MFPVGTLLLRFSNPKAPEPLPPPFWCRSSRSSVVCWVKSGLHVGFEAGPVQFSSGCFQCTVIGATYLTEVTPSARATAFEPTATLFTPTTFEKNPGAERFTLTVIV